MNAGLPGTGLGAIFYFFSVIAIFIAESVYFARHWRFSPKARHAALLIVMLAGIIASLVLFDLFIDSVLAHIAVRNYGGSSGVGTGNPSTFLSLNPIFGASIVLGAIVGIVTVAQAISHLYRQTQPSKR